MLLFLQALLIITLIPVYEIQAEMGERIKLLSQIDESLAEKGERLSESCSQIEKLNRELKMLETECVAAAKSPALTAPLILRAKGITVEQELIAWEMHSLVSMPDGLLTGIWTAPSRDASKPCLTSGELHWPGFSIAEFHAESGGAKVSEHGECEWKYHDSRVRPL